jgi:lipid A 3-O-deacylase
MKNHCLILLVLLLFFSKVYSQESMRNNTLEFLRIYEDNDFLDFRGSGTDRYYSNGLRIDFYYSKKNKPKFPSNLLMQLKNTENSIYGYGITQTMYTPLDISKSEIQIGDRPYAGILHLNHFVISSNSDRNERLVSEINLGVTGNLSLAQETQTIIHRWIDAQKPNGWDNQIKTDLLLNYYLQYEKLVLQPSDKIDFIAGIDTNIGTMRTDLGLSLLVRLFNSNSYFKSFNQNNSSSKSSKLKFSTYCKPIVRAVMYNTTLEGGFFNGNSSPYILESNDLERFYMQYEYGFIFNYKSFEISFNEKIRTAEFKNALTQQVGNITALIKL